MLDWAGAAFGSGLAVASSFQSQSLPLLHLVSRHAPATPVLFLDTGYHFPETLQFRDEVVRLLGLDLVVVRGDKGAEQQASRTGSPLYRTDPDRCCRINKVDALAVALGSFDAWVSGVRRDQSPVRAAMAPVEDDGRGRVRIHPILDWTMDDVEQYRQRHSLPRHPLEGRGYTSIGCEPCTRRPVEGGDHRSGRWAGHAKTECGLHTELRDSTGGQ